MPREPEAPPPRFVLLEHRWGGVHWDFMLERDGVLKTWALDAPPRPGGEVDARELPDHRAAYLDYEGPISRGRGAVSRVDGGRYEPIEWADGLVRVRLAGRQLVGEALLTRRPRLGSNEPGGPGWKLALGNAD